MFKARFTDPQTQEVTLIDASNYDAQSHEGHLTCADYGCGAAVHWRGAHLAEGGAIMRRAHFVSDDRHHHHENCAAINPDKTVNLRLPCESVEKALKNNITILLNLNLASGMPVLPSFNAAARKNPSNPYQKWQSQHSYAAYSMNSTDEIMAVIEAALRLRSTHQFDNIYVGHKGDVRALRDIIVDATDPEKTQQIEREFRRYQRYTGRSNNPYRFPMILLFTPSYQSVRKVGGQSVTAELSAFQNAAKNRIRHLIALHNGLNDTDLINMHSPLALFAQPRLPEDPKASGRIEWHIRDKRNIGMLNPEMNHILQKRRQLMAQSLSQSVP
jgi:hypothetical protein